jgi:hypothetical protein
MKEKERMARIRNQNMKTTILLIAIALVVMCNTLGAQEVRRAVPVVPGNTEWRSLPRETTWQWLVRTGMCTTGLCEGGHGGAAFINWGEAKEPVYDNTEIEPDEILLAPYPFTEPAPDNPLYNAEAEQEIKRRLRGGVHDETVTRVYRRGVFVGYARARRVQPDDGRIEI